MKKKVWSVFLIGLIYIAAIASGAAILFTLKSHIQSPIINMLIANIVATVVIYIFSVIFENASLYDPYWSVMPVFMVFGYYTAYLKVFYPHHLFILIPLVLWSLRLTSNWVMNFKDMQWQDWRYLRYKKKYPKYYQLVCFFGIMLMPTLLIFFGSIPLKSIVDSVKLCPLHIVGGIIMLSALSYQAIADFQLRRFSRGKNDKEACINSGLWKLSRHPNYFGEISLWWGMAISVLGGSAFSRGLTGEYLLHVLTVIAGAVLITLLFIFISVPLMENRMLEKRPSYADYKKTVRSPLVPFLHK